MGQKLTEKLPVKLSEKQLNKTGQDLVDTEDKIAAIEAQKSAANAKFKGDIELLEEVAGKLRTMIRTGCEERDVQCEVERDYNACEVVVRRLDTKEVVTRRTMTADEKQKDMFDDGPAGKKKGRGKKESVVSDVNPAGEEPAAEKPEPLTATVGELAGAKAGKKKRGKAKDGEKGSEPRWPGDENPEKLGF